MLLAKLNIPYKVEQVEFRGGYKVKHDSLYELVTEQSKYRSILLIEDKVAYIDEIRPDYVNGELYIPMFTCKVDKIDGIEVEYDNKIEKVLLHSYKTGYTNKDVYIIPVMAIPEAYKLDLKQYKLSRKLTSGDEQARNLFIRYVAYSYQYTEDDNDMFDYTKVQKQFITKKQRDTLKENNLEFYGDYLDMDYRDVRNWKLIDLQGRFADDELSIGSQFNCRRLAFELELYTRVYDKKYWDKWTRGKVANLIDGTHSYIKYKESGIYMIFKGRWVNFGVLV